MKNLLFFFAGLIIFLSACGSDNSSENSIKAKGEEDPLVERYMKEMIANPTNQDHIDRNLIVNMLIDSLWDFRKTESGIYYQIEKEGEGAFPDMTSMITCHYRGTLMNGQKFDSSYDRNQPLKFNLGQMVAGWQGVIPMLRKGGKGTFIVPSRLAYGEAGYPGTIIKPNSVLIFDIELLDFQ